MFFPYLVLYDETNISHSEVKKRNGEKFVEVQFERPREKGGFYSARCELPSYKWLFNEYFSNEELSFFTKWLEHNAHTIFKYAECGGIRIA